MVGIVQRPQPIRSQVKTFQRFSVTNDTTEVSDRINCIFEDSKGRLWISFAGLHQKVSDSKFVTYTTQHGLPVNIIQYILEDNKGNLWLGTTHGLCVFNPESKTFKTYDESDGLLTQEFRRKAFFKADDGQLFVGGKGIIAFYPDSLSINSDEPFVYVTDLKIFNQSVKPNGQDGILKQSITQTREISLNHRQTFFSIHYVGINFTASYMNRMPTCWKGLIRNGIMWAINVLQRSLTSIQEPTPFESRRRTTTESGMKRGNLIGHSYIAPLVEGNLVSRPGHWPFRHHYRIYILPACEQHRATENQIGEPRESANA